MHMEGREGGRVGVRKKMTDMWGAILSEFPVSMTFSIQVKLVRLKQWKIVLKGKWKNDNFKIFSFFHGADAIFWKKKNIS